MEVEAFEMSFQDELGFDQWRKVAKDMHRDVKTRMQRTNCGNKWPIWPKRREELGREQKLKLERKAPEQGGPSLLCEAPPGCCVR